MVICCMSCATDFEVEWVIPYTISLRRRQEYNMATTTTEDSWADVGKIQRENIQMREEINMLQHEVAQLRAWKARAMEHMTTWAPQRNRVMREKAATLELRQKMQHLHRDLSQRKILEEKIKHVEQTMKNQHDALRTSRSDRQEAQARWTREQLAHAETKRHNAQLEKALKASVDHLLQVQTQITMEPAQDHEPPPPPATSDAALQWAQQTISWFDQHLDEWTTFLSSSGTRSSSNEPNANELKQTVATVQHEIASLRQALNVEQGVTSALEKLQIQKDWTIKSLTQNMHTLELDQKVLVHFHRDVKRYIQLMQNETKRKYGYSGTLAKHPDLSQRVSLALHDVEKYRHSLQSMS